MFYSCTLQVLVSTDSVKISCECLITILLGCLHWVRGLCMGRRGRKEGWNRGWEVGIGQEGRERNIALSPGISLYPR